MRIIAMESTADDDFNSSKDMVKLKNLPKLKAKIEGVIKSNAKYKDIVVTELNGGLDINQTDLRFDVKAPFKGDLKRAGVGIKVVGNYDDSHIIITNEVPKDSPTTSSKSKPISEFFIELRDDRDELVVSKRYKSEKEALSKAKTLIKGKRFSSFYIAQPSNKAYNLKGFSQVNGRTIVGGHRFLLSIKEDGSIAKRLEIKSNKKIR